MVKKQLTLEALSRKSKIIVAKIVCEGTNREGARIYNPYVIASTHPRYTPTKRFDYGFMQIALDEGYTVILQPRGK